MSSSEVFGLILWRDENIIDHFMHVINDEAIFDELNPNYWIEIEEKKRRTCSGGKKDVRKPSRHIFRSWMKKNEFSIVIDRSPNNFISGYDIEVLMSFALSFILFK